MTNRPEERLADIAADVAWVRRLAIAVASDAHVGEEIAQEALLAAAKPGVRPIGSLRSWLAGAVRKLHLRRGRSDADRKARERRAARPDVIDDPTLALERLEIQEALSQAVRELEEPYRSTVLLRWFEGLEPEEIARRTGVPVRTVHTRVTRALPMLRETLDRRSHGDRSRWMSAWMPLLPSSSSAVKVTIMGIKMKLAIVVAIAAVGVTAIIPVPGRDYESTLSADQYGNFYSETKHSYPRISMFAPLVAEYSVHELLLPDRSRVRFGAFTRWARDGRTLEQGNYEYGKRTGRWGFWNEDGTVDHVRSGVYENDMKVRG